MASGRRYYSIERRGHRDGYLMRDVDNELLNDDETRKKEGKEWVWDGLSSELLTDIDVDDVWKRWRIALPVRNFSLFPSSFLPNVSTLNFPNALEYRQQISASQKMQAATSVTSSTIPPLPTSPKMLPENH